MSKLPTKFLVYFVISFLLITYFAKKLSIEQIYPHQLINLIKTPSLYLFGKFNSLKSFSASLSTISNLIKENQDLKYEKNILLSRIANEEITKKEIEFLKKSLGINAERSHQLISAGLYGQIRTPEGNIALINKGSDDNISEGDIVFTEDKILVGVTDSPNSTFTKVHFISNPGVKITAKVLGSDTVGIIKGDLDMLTFDLVIYNDDIKENDTIVSNGTDAFPAGLLIGKVKKVEFNENQLFKKVQVEPSVSGAFISRVMVIKK